MNSKAPASATMPAPHLWIVRDTGHADRYRDLRIQYIDHHNPDLFLFGDDDEELNRIDLTRLKTTKNIHKLLSMLGMRETCHDLNNECDAWAKSGQCQANPDFMLQSCRKSCGSCAKEAVNDDSKPPCVNTHADHDCEYWSTMGECNKNEAFMKSGCARSCGFCTVKERSVPSEEDDDLLDDDVYYRGHDEL